MLKYSSGKHKGGIFVKTEITNGKYALGENDQLNNARHQVKVDNLNLYPAKFKCTGSIASDPRNTKFKSPHPKDSDNEWNSHIKILPENQSFIINHVQIIPLNRGCDLILTEVNIDWPHPGRSASIRIGINCHTNL